jgi:hypothetical protein
MSSGFKKGTQICYPFPSKSLGKRILSSFPNGAPVERNNPLTGNFYLSLNKSLFVFPSESPVREPPSMFPNRVPMDSDTPSPEPLVYFSFIHSFIHSFMYVCRYPQKGAPLHTYEEKHKVTVHGAPCRRKTYIQWGAAWFPKGSLRHCCLYPSAMQPSARYLPPWLR